MAKKLKGKHLDAEIARAYYRIGDRVQIPIMTISKIFAEGRAAYDAHSDPEEARYYMGTAVAQAVDRYRTPARNPAKPWVLIGQGAKARNVSKGLWEWMAPGGLGGYCATLTDCANDAAIALRASKARNPGGKRQRDREVRFGHDPTFEELTRAGRLQARAVKSAESARRELATIPASEPGSRSRLKRAHAAALQSAAYTRDPRYAWTRNPRPAKSAKREVEHYWLDEMTPAGQWEHTGRTFNWHTDAHAAMTRLRDEFPKRRHRIMPGYPERAYPHQNPSSGAKQRARGTRTLPAAPWNWDDYGAHGAIHARLLSHAGELRGRLADRRREGLGPYGPAALKRWHSGSLQQAAAVRKAWPNPARAHRFRDVLIGELFQFDSAAEFTDLCTKTGARTYQWRTGRGQVVKSRIGTGGMDAQVRIVGRA